MVESSLSGSCMEYSVEGVEGVEGRVRGAQANTVCTQRLYSRLYYSLNKTTLYISSFLFKQASKQASKLESKHELTAPYTTINTNTT